MASPASSADRQPPALRGGVAILLALLVAAAAAIAQEPEPAPAPAPDSSPAGAPTAPAASSASGSDLVLRPREAAPAGDAEMTGIEAAEVGVLKLWFQRRQALEQQDESAAADAVRRMEALMDREGIRGMETLAGAFAHEGYGHLESGNYLAAQESFLLALRFDPGLPAAHFGVAEARRLSGQGFAPYLQGKIDGIRAAAGNFWWTYIALTNELCLLLLGIAVLALCYAVLQFVRHGRAWRHDLAEFLAARGLSEFAARLGAAALAVAPALLWISGPWLLLYWLAGTFRYQRRAERAITVLALLFTIGAGPAVSFLLSAYQVTESDTMKATVSALRGGYEPEKVRYIQQVLERRPEDPTFHFLLAALLKDGGYFVEAFQHYRKVLDLEPDNARACNNVGNIYFATGQHGQAVAWYRKATEIDPEFAVALFNANLAQKEQFHFTEAEASLDRARSLDPDAVAHYLERAGEAAASPVDAKIPMSEAWFEVVRGRRARGGADQAISPRAWLRHPLSIGGAAALAASLLFALLRRGEPATPCPRCGRASCARCRQEGSGGEFCPQCTHMFVNRGEVAPAVRQEKQQQIARHERWTAIVRRAVSLPLPGAAQILGGRTMCGIFVLGGWLILVMRFWIGPQLPGFPASPYVAAAGWSLWIGAGLLALFLLLGNLLSFERRPLP